MLSQLNAHERDSRVTFDEPTHTYSIDGDSTGYVSTTTFIHSLFSGFHADSVISKMMQSPKWPESKYFGLTRDEIKTAWEKNAASASSLGTAMHANIENFYNGKEHETESKEWSLFEAFRADYPNLEPWRSEMTIWSQELGIAGSIDMVYKDPEEEGAFLLYDWKRSKEIKMDNKWQKGTHPLTKGFHDCNFNHYSLQLAIYKKILQTYYGYKVNGTFLMILHPDQENYLRIETRDVDSIVDALFAERIKERASKSDAAEAEKEDVDSLPFKRQKIE